MSVQSDLTAADLQPKDALEVESEVSFSAALRNGFDAIDVLLILTRNKWTIARIVSVITLLTVLFLVLLPNTYTSETRIMVPQQTQNTMAAAILGQLGSLSGLVPSDVRPKNSSDVYVSLLASRSIADAIITRFDLMRAYGSKRLIDAREELTGNTVISVDRTGVISVQVDDQYAGRAAAIANGYVVELFQLNQRLAITEASQRRIFYQRELEATHRDLANAEDNLRKTQESTGLIQLDSQAKAIIEAMTILRAQIAAKEVQLHALRSFGTDQNPEVVLATQQMAALQQQLANLERGPAATRRGDILVPTSKVPGVGAEYLRRLRDVKYYEAVFEAMGKQFEIAKVDEARNASIIQVVDTAVIPEKKSGPRRLRITIMALISSTLLAVAWVVIQESFALLRKNRRQFGKLQLLRTYWLARP